MKITDLKKCGICQENHLLSEYPLVRESFLFHDGGSFPVCYNCISKSINPDSLDDINKLSQFLDIAFLPNAWIRTYNLYFKDHGIRPVIENYIKEARAGEYTETDWNEQNLIWEKVKETQGVLDLLPDLRSDMLIYLRKKWGVYEGFGVEDYIKMEAYEKNTLNHYNFRDEARRDIVRKMALLSVLIDKKLAEGETKEMANLIGSYQSLIKESGIQNIVSNDTETLTSISEVIAYLEKTGWMIDYRITEDRDIVDATITNMQQYLNRLVSDSSEEVRTNYETERLNQTSGTVISEEQLDAIFAGENTEEELIEEELLSEEELIEMFREVDKEYGSK
jgi:hypothetical protein